MDKTSLINFDTSVLEDVGNNRSGPDSPFDPFEPKHLEKALKTQQNKLFSPKPSTHSDIEYESLCRKVKDLQERSKKLQTKKIDLKKPEEISKKEFETSIKEMEKDVFKVKNKLLEKVKNVESRSPQRRFSSFKDDFGDLETSFNLLESSLHWDADVNFAETPPRRKSLSVGDLRPQTVPEIPFEVIQNECQKIIDYIDSLKENTYELLKDEPAPMNVSNSSEDEFGLPNVLKVRRSSTTEPPKADTITRYRKLSLTLNSEPETQFELETKLNGTFEIENPKPKVKDILPVVQDLPPKIVKKGEIRPVSRKGPLKAFAPVPPVNGSVSDVSIMQPTMLPKASSTPMTRQNSNPSLRRENCIPKTTIRMKRSSSTSRINVLANTSAHTENSRTTPSRPNDIVVRGTRSSTLRANLETSKINAKVTRK